MEISIKTSLLQRAIAIQEKVFGPEHPDVAILNNLALLYYGQGRYSEAEPLYRDTLAIFSETLPADHLHVARALEHFAPACSTSSAVLPRPPSFAPKPRLSGLIAQPNVNVARA